MPQVAHTLRAAGHDGSEDGTGRGTPLVAEAFDARQSHVLAYGEQAGPLDTDGHSVAVLLRNREGRDGGGKGPLLIHDESLTLATGNDQVLFAPVPLKAADSYGSNGAGTSSTSWTSIIGGPGDPARTPDAASVEPVAAPFTFDSQQITSLANRTRVGPDEPVSTLAAGSNMHAATAYGVRRLTPVECERLQGFDDGWTEPAGSDAARYRALGNAVTVPVPAWLFARIRERAL